MEKQALTESGPRSHVIPFLVAIIAVVSTLLVTLAVFGGLYVTKLQSECDNSGTQPQYQETHSYKNAIGSEDVQVDISNQVEKLVQQDDQGHIVNIIVLDYKKRLVSIYHTETDQCYLRGGIDPEIGNFNDSQIFLKKHEGQMVETQSEHLLYHVVDMVAVTDSSLIPQDLSTFCGHNNVFWVEKISDSLKREKRGEIHIKGEIWGIEFEIDVSW